MDWDTLLRAASAVAWCVNLILAIRRSDPAPRGALSLTVLSIAALLVVIAAGPSLVSEIGGWAVKSLYTATAAAVLIVGVAVAVLLHSAQVWGDEG